MRGLTLLAEYDPAYWADDGRPGVIDLASIAVGDHERDVLAQVFRGQGTDPYLTGLAVLGIPVDRAGEYGFAGPGEPHIALAQGIHLFILRADTDSRLPHPEGTCT